MLEQNPDLLNSVNNLGGCDWEDAVSASGQVGHREMTNFLLEKGARMAICVACHAWKNIHRKKYDRNISLHEKYGRAP